MGLPRRRAVVATVVACLLLGTSAGSAAAAPPVRIIVNGHEVMSDPPAYIRDGRTLVGVRTVAEAVGGQVEWDEAARQVRIARGSHRLILTIGSPFARYHTLIVNRENRDRPAFFFQETLRLDVAPEIDSQTNRTVLPFRAVTEALNCRTMWDGAARIVAVDCSQEPIPDMLNEALGQVQFRLNADGTGYLWESPPGGWPYYPATVRALREVIDAKVFAPASAGAAPQTELDVFWWGWRLSMDNQATEKIVDLLTVGSALSGLVAALAGVGVVTSPAVPVASIASGVAGVGAVGLTICNEYRRGIYLIGTWRPGNVTCRSQ